MPEIVAAMPPAAARYAKKGCGYDVVTFEYNGNGVSATPAPYGTSYVTPFSPGPTVESHPNDVFILSLHRFDPSDPAGPVAWLPGEL
eukprot:8132-Pelagococcus_subviridis.AAC.3